MIPVIQCICHHETKEVVDLTLKALIHLLQQRHGINLVDFVGEWFWHGDQGAISSLASLFPDARGHLCLEHAKRNAEKRYKDGYKNVVMNFIEFSAFMRPWAFTVSVDLFLESLIDGNHDTVYLTTANQGACKPNLQDFQVLETLIVSCVANQTNHPRACTIVCGHTLCDVFLCQCKHDITSEWNDCLLLINFGKVRKCVDS